MGRPFDATKLNKHVKKSIPGISYGFNDPKTWMDTGCYMLNYLISNRFDGGIPLEGKVTMFAGDSGCLPASAKVVARIRLKPFNIDDAWFPLDFTVEELRKRFMTGNWDIEISTPDGFQPIVSWWDKGPLPIVAIRTHGGLETRCAVNHLLQRTNETWVLAGELTIDDELLTVNGVDTVESTLPLPDEECYDFEVGHPNHRYWGDGISSHNSGKSYITSANIIKWCQANGVWPVLIDTENSLDLAWLEKLGVDTSDEKMDKYLGTLVDDVAALAGNLIENYKELNQDKPYAERGRMLIIIDSLGMLITPNQEKQMMEGDQKGDMGIKAKAVTNMIRVLTGKIGTQPIGLVVTNHVYDSQDKYKPDSIPGGMMLEFASSIIVQMNKLMLKQDENGKDLASGVVSGMRSSCVVRKSRYSKPFEKLKIDIPYDIGMNRYSGLFDLFEAKGVIQKQGNRYGYTSPATGEMFLEWRKDFRKKGLLDQIMAEWSHWESPTGAVGFDETSGANVTAADLENDVDE